MNRDEEHRRVGVSMRKATISWIVDNGIVAAGYGLGGWLGLQLAVPPDMASAFWPPAGVALAAIVLKQRRAWFGIWLGAVLLQFVLRMGQDVSHFVTLLWSMGLACGVWLQAVVGGYFAKRWLGEKPRLEGFGEVVRFSLVCIASCLVNALVSPGLLGMSGQIPWSIIPVTSFTWWIGDSLGALLISPILFLSYHAIFAGDHRKRAFWVSVLMIVLSILTVAFCAQVRGWELERVHGQFRMRARALFFRLEERLTAHEEVVRALRGFVHGAKVQGAEAPAISCAAFRAFSRSYVERYASLRTLLWAPRDHRVVRPSLQRARAQLQGVDTNGMQRGASDPPLRDASHLPVRCVEPDSSKSIWHDADLFAFPEFSADLSLAARRDEIVVATRAMKDESAGHVSQLLMFAPVFGDSRTTRPSSPIHGERLPDALLGFSVAAFDTRLLIGDVFDASLPESMSVRIMDVTRVDEPELLFEQSQGMKFGSQEHILGGSWSLHVGTRTWSAEFRVHPSALRDNQTWQAYTVLAGGLLLVAMLGMLLMAGTGYAQRIEHLVLHRTDQLRKRAMELEHANRELQRFAYAASHDLRAPLRAVGTIAGWLEHDLGDNASAESREHIRTLCGRVKRMETLLDSLLEYATIGHDAESIVSVDVAELWREVSSPFDAEPSVELSTEGALPRFETNRTALAQVLSKLIENAIKHNPANRVRVLLRVQDLGTHYRFSIEDDGPGIPIAYREQVFEIFRTLKRRDEVEGSGVGLALVMKRVYSAGGMIQIEDSRWSGTCLNFTWSKDWSSTPATPDEFSIMSTISRVLKPSPERATRRSA